MGTECSHRGGESKGSAYLAWACFFFIGIRMYPNPVAKAKNGNKMSVEGFQDSIESGLNRLSCKGKFRG